MYFLTLLERIDTYWILLLCLVSINLSFAQQNNIPSTRKFIPVRAEENYDYLKNKKDSLSQVGICESLKFIPLNKNQNIYLSLGGQVRTRYEYYQNRFWNPVVDESFYSQRIAFHTNCVLGNNVRVFGELYHGYSSNKKEFSEYDKLNTHQAFIEYKAKLKKQQSLSLRFGRQEMGFGASRLVGIREGPNIRRSFDMMKGVYHHPNVKLQTFYGKEVNPKFEVFDNEFSLFDSEAANPELWGVYTHFKVFNNGAKNELYYFGFQSDKARFNDVTGKELRHTIGLRSFGKLGKGWNFNTEVSYQFGEIDGSKISAFNIEGDWRYDITQHSWTPGIGLKLEYTSGDNNEGDDKINTFNPLFVNPVYYSLASTITPINLISIHPSLRLKPGEQLTLYAEWGMFWRASQNDALYSPPRFILVPTGGVEDKKIGNQFGIKTTYEHSINLSFVLDVSYFVAGGFLDRTGASDNILHVAPTVSFIF